MTINQRLLPKYKILDKLNISNLCLNFIQDNYFSFSNVISVLVQYSLS